MEDVQITHRVPDRTGKNVDEPTYIYIPINLCLEIHVHFFFLLSISRKQNNMDLGQQIPTFQVKESLYQQCVKIFQNLWCAINTSNNIIFAWNELS